MMRCAGIVHGFIRGDLYGCDLEIDGSLIEIWLERLRSSIPTSLTLTALIMAPGTEAGQRWLLYAVVYQFREHRSPTVPDTRVTLMDD